MRELRELFEQAADSPPPSRLIAEEVYAAGRRGRRRSALATSAAAGLSCVVVLAVAVFVATGAVRGGNLAPSATGGPGIGQQRLPGVLPHPGERIQWVGAADARHLYVALSTLSSCTTPPCSKTILQLVGSDNGGRTWSDRGAPINLAGVAVLGPDRLVAAVVPRTPGTSMWTLQTSVDGGRTWYTPERSPAVAAVPSGSATVCISGPGPASRAGTPCKLHALDPVSRRLAPLAAPPPLTLTDQLSVEESAGQMWVPGIDPVTGRPAVAVSTDAGRTWSTQVFTDAPACAAEGCSAPSVAIGADRTGYVVVVGGQRHAVYRYLGDGVRDGSRWQRATGADSAPVDRTGGPQSFIAADGAHVLCDFPTPDEGASRHRCWAARDAGASYEPVELYGLPTVFHRIRHMSNGGYYTHSSTDGVLYGSTDGWRWSPVARSS